MRLDPCTFDSHGPILTEPLRQIRNNISIVWLSPPLFEFKQNVGSIDRTLTVTFPLIGSLLRQRAKDDQEALLKEQANM